MYAPRGADWAWLGGIVLVAWFIVYALGTMAAFSLLKPGARRVVLARGSAAAARQGKGGSHDGSSGEGGGSEMVSLDAHGRVGLLVSVGTSILAGQEPEAVHLHCSIIRHVLKLAYSTPVHNGAGARKRSPPGHRKAAAHGFWCGHV
jgi:hypothetical protein